MQATSFVTGCASVAHCQTLGGRVSSQSLYGLRKPAAVKVSNVNRKVQAVVSPSAPEVSDQTVEQWMSKENILTCTPETTVDQALETLVESRISGLPVVDSTGKVVGVVSDFDLLALGSTLDEEKAGGFFPTASADWNSFFEMQKLLEKNAGKFVKDLMTKDPICVRPETTVQSAANLLLRMKIHRLPVVDESGKVVGVISRGNVIRAALAARRASSQSS